MTEKAKPFIKWVGGKRQLMNELLINLPSDFNNYFEPFVGGGALFYEMQSLFPNKKMTINDFNKELSNVYKVVKLNPDGLMKSLSCHINDSDYYYRMRLLDRQPEKYDMLSDVEKASRFIYINKTCYSGIYRVNKSDQQNVPFGNYKSPNLFTKENITSCSLALAKTNILSGDFGKIKKMIKKGDLVYFDPPYEPINKTANFTSYTSTGFKFKEQKRLKKLCDYIDSIGAFFMVSNSSTKKIYDLYENYNIKDVDANRAINSNSKKRGKIKEVLVSNY